MPKMIVSIDGVVIKEVQLTKDRTTLGRRPYNDVVIDNLAVSGEHAVFQMTGSDVFVEDLNSTNGTYVNGKTIKKQQLHNDDSIEVGKYKIRFVSEKEDVAGGQSASHGAPGASSPLAESAPDAAAIPGGGGGKSDPASPGSGASVKVLSGAAAGREVALTKIVTTVGKPGVAVAAITNRQSGFVVHHVEGSGNPTLNGSPIGTQPLALKNGDLIELAGTQMQFVQR